MFGLWADGISVWINLDLLLILISGMRILQRGIVHYLLFSTWYAWYGQSDNLIRGYPEISLMVSDDQTTNFRCSNIL